MCLGAAIQNRKQLVQRFFPAEIVLREFAEHAHALGKDDVLVKLAPIPMTPLFVGEVFFLVVGTVKKFINFNADLYGHELPAVIADCFGDVIVLQVLCLGMEAFKQDIVDALVAEMHPQGIYERNDVPVRELEGLEQHTGLLYGTVPDKVEMVENGVRFLVDVKEGQKTGFFLDQKENRAAIAPFVKDGRVLDCFTHTGSFALHAGRYGAKEVIGVDISDFACQCARENARLNGLENTVRFECANAFDYLRAAQENHEQFDVVILDPPAFTKTRSAVEGALRGYKEINLRGMKLARDGGFLVTCSCSQHVLPHLFQSMVLDAQKDARVGLRQVEWRTQGRDHPILPAAPETQYLKCGIYQVFK